MAGLPGSGAIVGVGPPLACSGPSSGLIGEPEEPTWSPTPVQPVLVPALPMRLYPSKEKAPSVSGFAGAVLPAMMLLRTKTVELNRIRPPAERPAVLLTMVQP